MLMGVMIALWSLHHDLRWWFPLDNVARYESGGVKL